MAIDTNTDDPSDATMSVGCLERYHLADNIHQSYQTLLLLPVTTV